MNRGLLEKSFREIWPITLGFGVLLFGAEVAIAFVSRQISANQFGAILQADFVRNALSAMIGTAVTAAIGQVLVQTLPWMHPLVMLVLFSHNVTVCTQMPAGEIDRGTIDALLGMPVSRRQVYLHHSLVWACSGFVLNVIGVAGNWCGTALAHGSMGIPGRLAIVFVNAISFYLAIGGICYFVSCISERRGRAVMVIIGVMIGSFLLNVVADAWAPARPLNALTLVNYFRPIFILRDGVWPIRSILTLLTTGFAFWVAGGIIFRRRDLHTL